MKERWLTPSGRQRTQGVKLFISCGRELFLQLKRWADRKSKDSSGYRGNPDVLSFKIPWKESDRLTVLSLLWMYSLRRWISGWSAAWLPAADCAGSATPRSSGPTLVWVSAMRWFCLYDPHNTHGPSGPSDAPSYHKKHTRLSKQLLIQDTFWTWVLFTGNFYIYNTFLNNHHNNNMTNVWQNNDNNNCYYY